MPFPAGLTLVSVHCQVDTLPDGGASGTVRFTCTNTLVGATDNSVVPPFVVSGALDASGECTVQLPSTNDPQWTPQDWTYAVRLDVTGGTITGTLQLDYQTTSVELADLLQVDGTADAGTTYIALTSRGVAGGVAGLDGDGDVTDADGNKITSGAASPSDTAVSETAYGQSAAAGVGTAYSRGDHTHGTPAAPAAATISDSTATGRSLITAADAAAARSTLSLGGAALLDVGTAAGTVAAGDDSRITGACALSTLTTKGDLYVATGSATVTRLAVGSDDQVLTADSAQASGLRWAAAGGGTAPTFSRAVVTSGDISDGVDASLTIVSGLTLSLAASVGDEVTLTISAMIDNGVSTNNYYEAVVIVSDAIARYSSTSTDSPSGAAEGDPSIYPRQGIRFNGGTLNWSFTVAAGDLDAGNVVFGLAHIGPSGGKVFASTDYPFRWSARNDHQ